MKGNLSRNINETINLMDISLSKVGWKTKQA
jgi:hypothetical protein